MRMTRKSRRQRQRREKIKNGFIRIAQKGLGVTAAAMLFWSTFATAPLYAMPTNGQVAAGNASIVQNGNVMNITQVTNKAAINWNSFSIAAKERVNFNQPNANAVILNRVLGNDPSKIFGQMNANGKVFIVNPNGVLFAPGAQVNVGGLLATTHSISDADFMNGKYNFVGTDANGRVINQGTIIAENGGIVALLAPEAINEGIIVAQKGTVAIASANQATFDFTGDGKMQLVVDESAVKALAENRGIIEADGGLVLMTASAKRELASAVVNQSGIVRATSLGGKAGSVEINAANGTANVAGTIDASGASAGAKGGSVDIFAKDITLESSAQIDASGDIGGGKVRIGGDWQGSGDAPHADNVTIAPGAAINSDAITKGDGGTVVAWSDGVTRFDGSVSAKGGKLGGDGGKVETSGHVLKIEEGSVNASATDGQAGEWLLDPGDITIATSGVSVDGGGNYTGTGTDSAVDVNTVNTALSGGTNVKIQTDDANGNIKVAADIAKSNGGDATLTLQAHNNIEINDNIKITSTSGKLHVDLFSDSDTKLGGGVKIGSGAEITTSGGNFTIRGGLNGYANSTGDDHGVNIAGTVNTGGGAIKIHGQTNSAQTTHGGVMISGRLESGGGEVTLQGIASTGAGINLSGTGTITGKNVNLIADKMNFVSGSKITGSSSSHVLNIKPLSVTSVNIGSGSGGLSLASSLFAGSGRVFEGFSQINIGGSNSNAGIISVSGATFDDTALTELVLTANNVTVGGALTAAEKTVTIQTSGTSSNDGQITAGAVILHGTGADFTFSNAANTVGSLAGNVKSVNFTNSGSLNVGIAGDSTKTLAVGSDSKLTAESGNVNIVNNISSSAKANLDIEAKNGNVNLTDASINTAGGNITFLAKQAINLNNGRISNTAKATDVTFKADASLSMTNGSAVSGTGKLNIAGYTASTSIGFGDGNGSAGLSISKAAAASFAAGFNDGILIGGNSNTGTINIGDAGIIQDKLTVRTSGEITFAANANLVTNNKTLTLDAAAIDFDNTGTATLDAGTSGLTLKADTISNWNKLGFASGATNGNLYITPQTQSRGISVGGSAQSGVLSVDADALNTIALRNFDNVTIGQVDATGNTTGTGAVTIRDFTFAPTSAATNLIVAGGTATLNGPVTMNTGGYLAFKVDSLTQAANAGGLTVKDLSLKGAGDFKFLSSTNDIGNIAADVGSLTVYNGGSRMNVNTVGGINGIKTTGATGGVTFVTDWLNVTKDVNAKGELTVYAKTQDRAINIGGAKDSTKLSLTVDEISRLSGSKIILGDKTLANFTGNVWVWGPVTFNSEVEIWTKNATGDDTGNTGTVKFDGDITIGSGGSRNLSITAYDFYNTGKLKLKDLKLTITKGLGGFNGEVDGSGTLTIINPNDDSSAFADIYIVDNANNSAGYTILYDTLNKVLASFDDYSISGQNNIYLTAGELKASLELLAAKDVNITDTVDISGKRLDITAGGNVSVNGDVTVKGDALNITTNGANSTFTIKTGKSLTVDGSNSKVVIAAQKDAVLENGAHLYVNSGAADIKLTAGEGFVLGNSATVEINGGSDSKANMEINANNTALGTTSKIDLGQSKLGSFTLATDTLTAASGAKITGTGSLKLQQRSSGKDLYVVKDTTGITDALIITEDQLKGDSAALFADTFSSLTLGNIEGSGKVIIKGDATNGLNINNNVTIQTQGTIDVQTNLNILGNNRRVTLKSGAITNNGTSTINAGATGTINLYTDNLNVTGSNKVIGSGTLGIGTFGGNKAIYLGDGDTTSTGLHLTNDKFTGIGRVFGSDTLDFTAYSIGNSNQTNIYVNNSNLTKDTTLTANNITFNGAMNLATGQTLTLNALDKDTSIGESHQTAAGVITADKLVLNEKNHFLADAENDIGTLTANANIVHLKSKTMTVTDVAAAGSGIVSGDAVYLHATTPGSSGAESLKVNGNITADNGDITLVSDTMNFGGSAKVTGSGALTVQQSSSGTSMGIGDGNGMLKLGTGLFGGNVFSKGFSTVYLGREDSSGKVEVGGALNFVDDTIIRGGENGEILIKDKTDITTASTVKNFEFRTQKLYTEEISGGWYKINTGSSNFIITADDLYFSDAMSGSIDGTGKITLKTYRLGTDIYLGGYTSHQSGLYLKSGYFDGTNASRVFGSGYKQIILGQEEATGTLYQYGSTKFYSEVVIRQGSKGGGGVTVTGTIDTNGNNFTVESKEVNITDAHVSTGTGDVSITSDTLNITGNTKIKGEGDLIFKTYSDNTNISFSGTGGLVLDTAWFSGKSYFESGFKNVIIGDDSLKGKIDVSGLEVGQGFTTGDFTLVSGSGNITGSGVKMNGNNLDIKSKTGNVGITDLTADKVSASTGGYVKFDQGNIGSLGKINAGGTVTVKNNKELTVANVVTGGGEVDIQAKGNLTIGGSGSIKSNSNIYLTAEDGNFINNNTGNSDSVLNAVGRWVIFTKDSIGDKYGNLNHSFRRYGTPYNDFTKLTGNYGGNGIAYKNQPTIELYGQNTYGDGYTVFFTNGNYYLVIPEKNDRAAQDSAFWTWLEENLLTSGVFNIGKTLLNGRPNVTAAGDYYGTPYLAAGKDGNLAITFTGDNPLNYGVTVYLKVLPKKVTVTASDVSRMYDGTTNNNTSGYIYDGFIAGENADGSDGKTKVTINGSVVYSGDVGTAIDAGNNYIIGIDGSKSNLTSANYEFIYADGTLTITPRKIYVTTDNAASVYGDAITSVNGKLVANKGNGFVTGEGFSQIHVSGLDNLKNVGNYTVTPDGIIFANGTKASNYDVSYENGTVTIVPRKITVTIGSASRIYGEDNPGLKDWGYSIASSNGQDPRVGLVYNDKLTGADLSYAQSASVFADAGTRHGISMNNAQINGGTGNSNYDISYVDGNLDITKRKLAITADNKSKIYGEANSTAGAFTYVIGTGLVNGDTVSGLGLLQLNSSIGLYSNAGTYQNAILLGNALFSQGKASNYDIVYNPGNFTITPRPVLITAGNTNKTYGDMNPLFNGFTAEKGSSGTGRGLLSSDNVTGVTNIFTGIGQYTNAGTWNGVISPTGPQFSGSSASNYAFEFANGNLIINKRQVAVTANNVEKTYDGKAYTGGSVSYNGFVNGDNSNVIKGGNINYAGTSQGAKNAGTYGININNSGSNLTADNYTFVYKDGTLIINKRPVTVTANSYSKTYDGNAYSASSGGYAYDGFINGEDDRIITTGSVTLSGAANGAVNAGNYMINSGGNLEAQNYSFTYKAGTLQINKKPVTVTADSYSKTYDGNAYSASSGGYAYDGFVNGEDKNVITNGSVTLSGAADGAVNAGNYTIDANGNLEAQNYNFTYKTGTLQINKKLVTVTADSYSKTYDGNAYSASSGGYAYDGFVNGEDDRVITNGSVTLSGAANGAVNTGNYTINTGGNLEAQNYSFTYKTGTLQINKKPVTVTADSYSKTYDGNAYSASSGGYAYDGFVSGEDKSVITNGSVTLSGAADGAVNAGNYTIDANGNLEAQNYEFSYVGGKLIIDQRKVTITAGNTTKTYGDENPVFNGFTAETAQTGSNTGLAGTDAIGSVTNTYDSSIDKYTGAGQYTGVISSSDPIFSSGSASNYTFEFVNGNLIINKALLTITADDARRAQNSDNPNFTVQYQGFKNGDGETSLTGLLVTTPATKGSAPGSYEIMPGGAWSNNYEIVFNPGELTVYPVGAVDDVKTVTSANNKNNNNNNGLSSANPNSQTNKPSSGGPSQSPITDLNPPTPSQNNNHGMSTSSQNNNLDTSTSSQNNNHGTSASSQNNNHDTSASSQSNNHDTSASSQNNNHVPPGTNAGIVLQSGDSNSSHTFRNEGDGFALHFGGYKEGEHGHAGQSKESGAVPILFAQGGEQKLDAIYIVNYHPDKLAVLPASQGVTIPELNEVRPDANRGFSIQYQSSSAGSFEVSHGNGIVSIRPLDDKALETLTSNDKTAAKAILANGILVAIEDIGVAPDQLRAVYIFLEK